MTASLSRRVGSEFLGTLLLLATVVGSGIMGERLSGGNVAIALLANSLATGAALVAILLSLGSVSAQMNPAVTLCEAWLGRMPWREVPLHCTAQVLGAFAGVGIANRMFGMATFVASTHVRTGGALWLSEFVATFGLMVVIWGCVRARTEAIPYAVGAYIVAAYWFTSSTSFANPAVTLARSATESFAGIRLADVGAFVGMQVLGAVAGTAVCRWLMPVVGGDPQERSR